MSELSGRVSQIQALENGKGLQYIIDEAYKILGNPLLLHNMEYELLFCVKNVATDDILWNEIVDNGFFSDKAIHFFMDECFIDDVANSKTIALLKSDKLKYERLYGRVFNCYKNTVADLITVACDRPFEDQDAAVFEAICEKLSQEISTIDYFKRYCTLYHERLIQKLLNDDIIDKVVYAGHLSNLYENMKANIYVVAADIGELKADSRKLEGLRDLLKEMQPELKYAVFSGYIVIIAGGDEPEPDVAADLHRLSVYFNEQNIRTGISGCFDNLFNLRKYYDQAVESLKNDQY